MMFELADTLKQMRKPIVLMDPLDVVLQPPSPFAHCSCVRDDSARIGEAGADYFLERGHRHFAYVGETPNRNWSVLRGVSFKKRIEQAGYTCQLYPVSVDSTGWEQEEKQLLRWLTALPKPIGLLAAMDTRAHQVIDVCAEAGLQVPHEAAVLGVDNDELICNGAMPTLSSIQRDTVTCGFQAAQLLDRQMRKSNCQRQILWYGVSQIVSRDSTQMATRPPDLIAIRAREFIRINAGERIGVPDVVKHLNVSRRLAEMRFRAACDISLLQEIQNARLERVKKLLSNTDLTLTEICSRCNYQTDIHLRRLFKKRFGCTMSEYRNRSRAI